MALRRGFLLDFLRMTGIDPLEVTEVSKPAREVPKMLDEATPRHDVSYDVPISTTIPPTEAVPGQSQHFHK